MIEVVVVSRACDDNSPCVFRQVPAAVACDQSRQDCAKFSISLSGAQEVLIVYRKRPHLIWEVDDMKLDRFLTSGRKSGFFINKSSDSISSRSQFPANDRI